MYLAWKEIRYAKLRYSLIIGIMVLVAYVVFMLSGLANGLSDGHKKAVADWGAQTIVLSEDSNKVASASILARDDLSRVEAKEKAAVGLTSSAISHKGKSEKTNISVFGAEADQFVVPKVIDGRSYKAANEVIVSENLLSKGFALGDQIKLGSDEQVFTIVGVTKATTYSVVPVLYLNLDAYTHLKYGDQPFEKNKEPISLIAVKEPKSAVTIKQSKNQTKLAALTFDDFVENLPGYSAEKLTLNAMVYFLFVVVAAIVGIFLYVMTLQKTALFGVLKAQGVSTGYLVRSIVGQSLIVSIVGVLLAFLLSYLTSLVLPDAMPFTVNLLQWCLYGVVLIFVSIIGGLFSVRTVTKVDPITAIGGE
ncbi:FtsX-like permease family protein [Enterococcus sp.]|uniref:ABC transporter permease n=1 Tax=Enterococcus sp. TaxID=35783 RepID=UPI0025BC4A98|nr:FtsX-like permease family protein [Enterococcus sp.]